MITNGFFRTKKNNLKIRKFEKKEFGAIGIRTRAQNQLQTALGFLNHYAIEPRDTVARKLVFNYSIDLIGTLNSTFSDIFFIK